MLWHHPNVKVKLWDLLKTKCSVVTANDDKYDGVVTSILQRWLFFSRMLFVKHFRLKRSLKQFLIQNFYTILFQWMASSCIISQLPERWTRKLMLLYSWKSFIRNTGVSGPDQIKMTKLALSRDFFNFKFFMY